MLLGEKRINVFPLLPLSEVGKEAMKTHRYLPSPKPFAEKKEGEWKGTPHGRWCTDGGSDRRGEGKGETGDKSSNGISILGAEGFEGFANAGDSL